jgi:hypothetical protein
LIEQLSFFEFSNAAFIDPAASAQWNRHNTLPFASFTTGHRSPACIRLIPVFGWDGYLAKFSVA